MSAIIEADSEGKMEATNFEQIMDNYRGMIPVPLVDIARDLGLEVFLTRRFKDGKSGEIIKEDGKYVIYINANHPYARTRFTLAHEIAHFKLHKSFLDDEKEIEDFAGQTFSISPSSQAHSLGRDRARARDQKEIEADNLAAEILMPEDDFVRIWEQKNTIEEVATFFEVSPQAAEIRARVLLEKRRMTDNAESIPTATK